MFGSGVNAVGDSLCKRFLLCYSEHKQTFAAFNKRLPGPVGAFLAAYKNKMVQIYIASLIIIIIIEQTRDREMQKRLFTEQERRVGECMACMAYLCQKKNR